LLAGLNAALAARDAPGWCPRRDEAYLGVLVDDLVTRGVSEPYRMFTSRAEYRLQLREDNADLRLTPIGRELGLVDDRRWQRFEAKREGIERETAHLKSTHVHPTKIPLQDQIDTIGQELEREHSLFDLLRRPGVTHAALARWSGSHVDPEVAEQVEVGAKYAGYIERQREEVERQAGHEGTRIPVDIDYAQVRGLSREVQQKLSQHRPETVGQAGRIQGVTPAAISLLLVHLKRRAAAPGPSHEERHA
jgi:tRNA uridine 5-carboxymethylaminomethyl modification enzyme